MDEVDVLLHPLRSELNFPIGLKSPIELTGYRWDLPIFLLDSIFEASSDTAIAEEAIQQLGAAIEAGYTAHALQSNPHLILLDQAMP